MDSSTYEGAVATARLIYDTMLARAGGPLSVRVREFDTRAKSQLFNSYLHFENIRDAALAGDFEHIRIGYYRNEEWVAAKAENNQGRRNFIEWAAAGSSMGPQRLRHHAEGGAGSGGDTRGRS